MPAGAETMKKPEAVPWYGERPIYSWLLFVVMFASVWLVAVEVCP